MSRARLYGAALAGVVLVVPFVAHAAAAPGDGYHAAISPVAVQPSSSATFSISLTNNKSSPNAASEAHIQIPSGFSVSGVLSAMTACSVGPWIATADSDSIDLTAIPGDKLCPGDTLTVSFSATAPAGEGSYTWGTALSGSGGPFALKGSDPTVTVDGTPPTVTLMSMPSDPSNDPTPSFGFSSNEPGSDFACSLDNASFVPCSSGVTYGPLGDGSHIFAVQATDLAGNTGSSATYSWKVDATPPPAPAFAVGGVPPNPSATRDANFSFSDDEAGVTLLCNLDGSGFANCSSGTAGYVDLADGSHTFLVKAVDGAGNETSNSYTWAIDATPPPPPSITSAPQNPSGADSASFAFSDAETVIFKCQLDGGGYSTCPPASYSNLGEGSHTFDVKAVDSIGHESTVTSYTWTIDTVHPLVTLIDKPPLLTNQTTASFSFSSNKPSSTYQCKLDTGSFGSCTSPRLYTGLDDGSHTFSVRAVSFGNVGLTTEYTWIVDTVAPNTAIASTPPASSTSASANFTFTSTEAGSTFACGLDAGGTTSCESPKTFSGLGDGAHTFRVQAVDAAGNVDTTPASYSWQIAGVGPGTTDTTPPGHVKRLRRNVGYGSLKLSWTPPVDLDFDHVEVFVSTSVKSLPRTPVYKGRASRYTNRRFRNGLYYRYAVVSYDRAGNASRGAGAVVPPSILLRSPRDGRRVHGPPLLVWNRVARATYYNVQLYYGSRKVLSTWPNLPNRKLSRSWLFGGRHLQLRTGLYHWYVWPGFGARSKGRYGQLLGQSTFSVR